MSSWTTRSACVGEGGKEKFGAVTSKDWAYQFFTFLMEGTVLRL